MVVLNVPFKGNNCGCALNCCLYSAQLLSLQHSISLYTTLISCLYNTQFLSVQPSLPLYTTLNSMWIKIQQMQQYADIYSLQNYSTCFGCHSTHHQEYQKLLRGLVWTSPDQTRPRRRGVTMQVVWPVPEAAGTIFYTPDDGCCDTRNM